MNTDFPRILTLLRKEKGISQKNAAAQLGVSQALLSHYEKGIRECGLDFLVRCADFYQVSCDYLLGRSPERTGSQLTVEDLPEPDAMGKENRTKGNNSSSIMVLLHKKLIANSLNILFDLLQRQNSKALISEISNYLMLAVYRMFRIIYSSNPKNQAGMFTVSKHLCAGYCDASMRLCEVNAEAVALGMESASQPAADQGDPVVVTTETLSQNYPLFASSLFNLIKNAEKQIDQKLCR